ncbi:hypothetical protein BEWA_048910 [Theileria equi strain WA]|uniref:Uncharacterized protein n=1 Tax=Theileria equi strain WA TaxID=1537102 RepID=L1LAY0_THEEQ|nr:hypothetical protein BEWA_048910 [Theileria equi strain WA]EKX72424.1 hypothetical protein BEWA_048910 [Theileria equi strain WA]|eukprot:XP_004831876.1 hypothetical protein BEWA_048910 [Theileria equi strain WA]
MMGESVKDVSLNIAHPSRLLCKSFNYSFDGNVIKLVVPHEGVVVTKLLESRSQIWTGKPGEMFQYTKASNNVDTQVPCNNIDAKVRGLRTYVSSKSDFTMDLSASKDTDECTVFEADLLGVSPPFYFANFFHIAKEVKYSYVFIM